MNSDADDAAFAADLEKLREKFSAFTAQLNAMNFSNTSTILIALFVLGIIIHSVITNASANTTKTSTQ
jgi:hypothetical protein